MRLRESNYNHFVRLNDGRILGYNFLYRTMLLLSEAEYCKITSISSNPNKCEFTSNDGALVETLKKLCFIVSDSFNELDFIKFHYYRSLFRPTLVTLLLPTLDCNFTCPYCFEYKKAVYMSEETVRRYLNWVNQRLYNKTHFHITWFGGEPLLAWRTMKHITKQALRICDRRNIGYSASLTTNGYYLNEEIIRSLDKLSINNVHITFDGAEEYHNKYRKTTNGSGTFRKIVDNAESYCNLSKSKLPLGIRVNVTDENIDTIDEFLSSFSKKVKKRSRIYFRYVWSNEASGFKTFSTCATSKKPFDKLGGLYNLAALRGFRIDNPIDPINFNYCEVDFAYHFAIDPLGNIYLCTHSYKPEEALGNIEHDIDVDSLSGYCSWINVSPFQDKVCLACKLLPICKGGCRKARFHGKRKCLEEKYSIDMYVETLFAKFGCKPHSRSIG